MKQEEYFDSLVRDFIKVINACGTIVSKQDIEEVMEKINNKEYSIALQYLCYPLLESDLKIPEDIKKILFSLFDRMGITDEEDDDYWLWEKMRNY